jgi:hypothetical protein
LTTITTSNLIAQIDHLGAELCSLKKQTENRNIYLGRHIEFGSTPQSYFPWWETLKIYIST